jgi:hypothetical protein
MRRVQLGTLGLAVTMVSCVPPEERRPQCHGRRRRKRGLGPCLRHAFGPANPAAAVAGLRRVHTDASPGGANGAGAGGGWPYARLRSFTAARRARQLGRNSGASDPDLSGHLRSADDRQAWPRPRSGQLWLLLGVRDLCSRGIAASAERARRFLRGAPERLAWLRHRPVQRRQPAHVDRLHVALGGAGGRDRCAVHRQRLAHHQQDQTSGQAPAVGAVHSGSHRLAGQRRHQVRGDDLRRGGDGDALGQHSLERLHEQLLQRRRRLVLESHRGHRRLGRQLRGQQVREGSGTSDSGTPGNCRHTPVAAGTVCRASNGACDKAEVCDGKASPCPTDGFVAKGTKCRDASGVCTGSAAACPADKVQPNTTVCHSPVSTCDNAVTCDGASKTCATATVKPRGTVCRTAAGVCDVAEVCDGQKATCPANAFVLKGTQCRAMMGLCDVAETCTGRTASCPADSIRPRGYLCDAAYGATCSGKSVSCAGR